MSKRKYSAISNNKRKFEDFTNQNPVAEEHRRRIAFGYERVLDPLEEPELGYEYVNMDDVTYRRQDPEKVLEEEEVFNVKKRKRNTGFSRAGKTYIPSSYGRHSVPYTDLREFRLSNSTKFHYNDFYTIAPYVINDPTQPGQSNLGVFSLSALNQGFRETNVIGRAPRNVSIDVRGSICFIVPASQFNLVTRVCLIWDSMSQNIAGNQASYPEFFRRDILDNQPIGIVPYAFHNPTWRNRFYMLEDFAVSVNELNPTFLFHFHHDLTGTRNVYGDQAGPSMEHINGVLFLVVFCGSAVLQATSPLELTFFSRYLFKSG